ncbi:hypothetical protein CEUSTIGMA_g4926.t1 [Chlamydomonas eustigma]|uniref:CCZ1/INTU/HSP4 first Longin domain-containing protein n=1 Tax=Chlamydomonas eustigma TaxID=1157962 RepID=A0A250X3K2_9CHLO|nr:hypothetical protein CEUSTIGMA_g4926.t1 [Chlamydomonas eustigma]|eukprot:GAX77482.1 hypothetical protein CEUSTIGMA_g4926.t1 [Chlamydomonas eustigma]
MYNLSSNSKSSHTNQFQQNPSALFFKKHFRLCLAIYDVRRGQKEGQEHEKVLAFYPTAAALPIRSAIVGLAQAYTSFSSSFEHQNGNGVPAPDKAAVQKQAKFMECDLKLWAVMEVEPHIWFAIVVNKAWAGPGCSNDSLASSLTSLHSLFVLLHRPLTSLIDEDDACFFARRALQPFLDEAGIRLHAAGMRDPMALSNPLGMQHGIPIMATPTSVLLNTQSLVNQLMLVSSPAAGVDGRVVVGAAVCWQGHLLWGSLPLQDLQALTLLAGRALGPAVTAAAGMNGKGQGNNQDPMTAQFSESLLSPFQWSTVGLPFQQQQHNQTGSAVSSSSSSSSMIGSRLLLPRLKQPALSRGTGSAASGQEPAHSLCRAAWQLQQATVPTCQVWFQGLQQHCNLLPFYEGPLLVMMLLREGTVVTQEVIRPLAGVLSTECPALNNLLSQCLPPKNVWHYPGFRYCIKDQNVGSIKASPGKKVLTLSQQSLRMVAHMGNKLGHWSQGSKGGTRADPQTLPGCSSDVVEDNTHADTSTDAKAGITTTSDCTTESGGLESFSSTSVGLPQKTSEFEKQKEAAPLIRQAGAPIKSHSNTSSSFGGHHLLGRTVMACRGYGETAPWVIAKYESGRQMLVVMETVPDPTLNGMTVHVQRLCDVAAPGFFL